MKVILIEQASADMKWDARYDSDSFEKAMQDEVNSSAATVETSRSDASAYCIYTGTSPAARETAGKAVVIRPPEDLKIGRTEKNPEELERVYQTGRRAAVEQLDRVRELLRDNDRR